MSAKKPHLLTNPGGRIPLSEIIGRDEQCSRVWDWLERHSIYAPGERRVGKSCFLRKMEELTPDGWFVASDDLQGIYSTPEFAARIFEQTEEFLSKWNRVCERARRFWNALRPNRAGGFELRDIESSWKELLTSTLDDLVAHVERNNDQKLVFFWDEFPYMLQNVIRESDRGHRNAEELLDVLREYRQRHSCFRMMVTGSIGLHHVMRDLSSHRYPGRPFNDMVKHDLPPLERRHSGELAQRLLLGEEINVEAINECAVSIAEIANHIPYFIHQIVRKIKSSGIECDTESIRDLVSSTLLEENDPWELGHFRKRLKTYYGDQYKTVVAILDCVSTSTSPTEITAQVSAAGIDVVEEDVRDWLKLLVEDNYLCKNVNGVHDWKYSLVQEWWHYDRNLTLVRS